MPNDTKNLRPGWDAKNSCWSKTRREILLISGKNPKPTARYKKAAGTARAVLGQLNRAFHFRDQHILVGLYKAVYAGQAWIPR